MNSPATARKRSPAAAGAGHRAHVQVGDVADVDDAEGHPREPGHRAVEQPLDELDRGREVRAEHRAEDAHRIDDGELEAAALAAR